MKKIIFLFSMACMAFVSCKKDKAPATPDFTAQLTNTTWGGSYFDNSTPSLVRSYTIVLNAGGSMDWTASNPTNKLSGGWTIKPNTNIITFRFSGGAQNEWSGLVNVDRIERLTEPIPAGFHINNCMKNP